MRNSDFAKLQKAFPAIQWQRGHTEVSGHGYFFSRSPFLPVGIWTLRIGQAPICENTFDICLAAMRKALEAEHARLSEILDLN
jgi:hypothetical protein